MDTETGRKQGKDKLRGTNREMVSSQPPRVKRLEHGRVVCKPPFATQSWQLGCVGGPPSELAARVFRRAPLVASRSSGELEAADRMLTEVRGRVRGRRETDNTVCTEHGTRRSMGLDLRFSAHAKDNRTSFSSTTLSRN